MTSFSPSDAAFEGFRLSREKPKVLLAWAAVSFVTTLATLPLLIASGLGKAMMVAEGGDPSATVEALKQGGPAYLLVIIAGLVVQSVFVTAVYRAVLRPQESRFAYLRLGMDEVRQILLFFILLAILMFAVFVLVLVGGVAAAIASGLLNGVGAGGAYFASAAIALWVMGLVVFVVVRLSLSLPMTFDQKRVRVFAAWRLSKGSFWRLTGAYALAVVMFFIVWLLALIIFTALAAVVGATQGLDLSGTMSRFDADLSSLKAYFTLPTLVYALFSALISAIYYAVMVAPSAVAYQALLAERGEAAHALADRP